VGILETAVSDQAIMATGYVIAVFLFGLPVAWWASKGRRWLALALTVVVMLALLVLGPGSGT
jgi:ABC-type molybdate transport system permease subunit